MAVLSPKEILQRSTRAGFTPDEAITFTAIVLAESGGDTNAHNPAGTGDGIVQINLRAHQDVTLAQARDPNFAFPYAYRLFVGRGRKFTDWEAFTNGAYKRRLAEAASGTLQGGGAFSLPGLPDLNPVDDIAGAVKTLARVIDSIGSSIIRLIEWLSTAHNWLRIAYIIGGVAAAIVGVVILGGYDTQIGRVAMAAASGKGRA